jgi:hypothetical protein
MRQLIIKSVLELSALILGLQVLDGVHDINIFTDDGKLAVFLLYLVLLVRFRFLNYKRKE